MDGVAWEYQLRFANKIQSRTIDAIAQARGRWSIGKHMPQMRAAGMAHHFGAYHAVRGVTVLGNRLLRNRRIKTRPAATCVELILRRKQHRITHHAMIRAIVPSLSELTGERSLGAFFLGNGVSKWREFLAQVVGVHGCLTLSIVGRNKRGLRIAPYVPKSKMEGNLPHAVQCVKNTYCTLRVSDLRVGLPRYSQKLLIRSYELRFCV